MHTTKEIMSALGRKGKKAAGEFYRANEAEALKDAKKWFEGGFTTLVVKSVNHGLEVAGSTVRLMDLSKNTANAVASRIDNN